MKADRNRTAMTIKSRVKQALLGVADSIDSICNVQSKTEPPRTLSMHYGGGNYYDIAFDFFRILLDHANLKRDSRILDVGCGAGRIAAPLQYFLKETGRYEGIDIMPMGINHCVSKVTPRFPNFRFQQIDVFNSYYNPEGSARPEEYTFPFADGEFDIVLSTSVMTHLGPDAAARYVSETARVLRPGGTALHSFFVLDETSRAALARGEAAMSFTHAYGECLVRNLRFPEEAIAMPAAIIARMFEDVGVTPEFLFGTWAARLDGVSFQDIVLGRKSG
jgi:SAM-dependent methyltransferase